MVADATIESEWICHDTDTRTHNHNNNKKTTHMICDENCKNRTTNAPGNLERGNPLKAHTFNQISGQKLNHFCASTIELMSECLEFRPKRIVTRKPKTKCV